MHGTLLPRSGKPSDTAEPLFVDCSFEWERTEPVPPPRAGGWTECRVLYRFRGVLDLSHRFLREAFGEPDVSALDLGVRDHARTMLEGAEAQPRSPAQRTDRQPGTTPATRCPVDAPRPSVLASPP